EMSLTDRAEWLRGIRPSVHHWIGEQCKSQQEAYSRTKSSDSRDPISATRAYADLTLAFGLAWLGHSAAECDRLIEEAQRQPHPLEDIHTFLFRAYEYRIRQALEGQPRRGPLPAGLLKDLARLRSQPEEVDVPR